MNPRRFLPYILMLLLIASSALVSASAAEQAKHKGYTVGARGFAAPEAAQFKTMAEDVFKELSRTKGLNLEFRYLLDESTFEKALNSGELDFFVSNDTSDTWKFLNNDAFAPFFTTKMFGGNYRLCLWVKKTSHVKDLKDLSGADVVTYRDGFIYFLLRRLVGEAPEDFFGSLAPSPNAVSSIYALSLGTKDAAFVNENIVKTMLLTNPGPVKDIRSVACAEPFLYNPLFYRKKNVPAEILDRIKTIFMNYKSEPAFKKYMPLIRQFKLEFVYVSAQDYKPMMDIFKEAQEKGWDKDYARWIRIVDAKDK